MSLKRILLEFNPNQIRIGDETPYEKIRRNVGSIKKQPRKKNYTLSKQDVLDMFETGSEEIHGALEAVVNETDVYEEIPFLSGDDILELTYKELGDEVFDWKTISKTYGDEGADKQELWDWMYDYINDDAEEALYFIKDDYHNQILEPFLMDFIEDRGEEFLYDLESAVKDSKNVMGEDCIHLWRAIRVDLTEEFPLSINDGVGIFWSYEEHGAEPYGAPSQGEDVILEAYVPLSSVDWDKTLYKTFWHLRQEMEVELFKDEEIYLNKIHVENKSVIKDVEKKAQFILDTYFKKKKEKMGDGEMIQFRNKIEKYLKEKNKIGNNFSISFDNYYKTST